MLAHRQAIALLALGAAITLLANPSAASLKLTDGPAGLAVGGAEAGPSSNENMTAQAQTANETRLAQPDKKCNPSNECLASQNSPGRADLAPACYCDKKCTDYDDCCSSSEWAEPMVKRQELGADVLRARRAGWLCRRVGQHGGEVLVRATCSEEWARGQLNESTRQLERQRCELSADPAQSDPLGSLVPITDLASGVTFANAHCLRCNSAGANVWRTRQLIYWSPLIRCKYNLDSDDRNTLYDLIRSQGGRALVYSRELNKWLIKMPTAALSRPDGSRESEQPSERVCSVSSVAPDSVVPVLRRCRSRTLDSCSMALAEAESVELLRARSECQLGHQSLVYSHESRIAYRNLACARCNGELSIGCAPSRPHSDKNKGHHKLRPHSNHHSRGHGHRGGGFHHGGPTGQYRIPNASEPTLLSPPAVELSKELSIATGGELEGEAGRSQGGLTPAEDDELAGLGRTPGLGSPLAVIMDLYGGRQEDEQVGSVHGCEDATRQVFDPFFLMCRDIICGLNQRFVDGTCVALAAGREAPSNLAVAVSGSLLATAALDEHDGVRPTAAASTQPKPGELNVNGTEADAEQDKLAQSSSGHRPSDRLVVASGQEGGAHTASQTSRDDGCDGSAFAELLRELTPAELPAPSDDSRRAFAECGKILVQAEHYRLFTLAGANSSALLSFDLSTGGLRDQARVWALVLPYNLTLASSQFELVHAAPRFAPESGAFRLLICSPFKSDLVDKFKPTMVLLTTCCLTVSIASLVLYLLLYWLSTFDLRHLLVEMMQAGQQLSEGTLRLKFRGSGASSETSYNAVRSQSLSSRGVACLAAALLAAYLLFVLGHKQEQSCKTGGGICCRLIAAATYGSFLLAFSWMFLLSYDIWRTLRLATCHLQTPSMNSQSRRFIIYAMCAALMALALPAGALFIDQIGPPDCQAHVPQPADMPRVQRNCSSLELELDRLAQVYRPRFGQRAGSCWFANRRALALFFGLPVTLIMLANLLFFLHSSFMVIRTSSSSSKPSKWSSQSSSEQGFAHQNNLTTSSTASAQTIKSNLSLGGNQSCELYECSPLQMQIEATAKRLSEQQLFVCTDTFEAAAATSASPSIASSQFSFYASGSLASNFATKYDLHMHLHQLSAFVSSLARDYRLYCRLSTIMGLTWLTGLMASVVDHSAALWYLFVALNALQGLFIFVAFGFKRSRLVNVEILLNYLRFKLRRYFSGDRPAAKPPSCAAVNRAEKGTARKCNSQF